MTTLFDSAHVSKPHLFGRGVLPAPTAPACRSQPAVDDRAWWTAQTLGAPDATDYEVLGELRRRRPAAASSRCRPRPMNRLDQLAGEAEACDRMSRGLSIL